jgi:excisionase family DNA binding protein
MTLSVNRSIKQLAPTHEDVALARVSSQILALYSQKHLSHGKFKLISDGGEEEIVTIPAAALNSLVEILKQIAAGNSVSIVSTKKEITTQEAADLLQVSRPYFVELLESGKIPYRKVGTRRRVLTQDVINYKNQIDAARMQTLAELAAQAQELNMGY